MNVTNILNFYFPKFDIKNKCDEIVKEKISNNIIKEEDYEKEFFITKSQWMELLRNKCEIGKTLHKLVEIYYKQDFTNKELNIDTLHKYDVFNNLFKEKNIKKEELLEIFLEFTKCSKFLEKTFEYMYSEKYIKIKYNNIFITGIIDAVFKVKKNKKKKYYNFESINKNYKELLNIDVLENEMFIENNKQLILIDWKTNINDEKLNRKFKNCLFFLNNLPNNRLIKNILQLNLYRFMIENNNNYVVVSLFLILINKNKIVIKICPIIKKNFLKRILDFMILNECL